MKKKIVTAILLALLLCGLAAAALAATYGTVHGGWLRLRATPSYEGTIITSYKNGTVVTILSQENGWARVLTSDYRVGYMDARYLYIGSQPTVKPTNPPAPDRTWTEVNRTAYVTSPNGKGVRLRSSPVVNKTNVMGLYPVGRTVKEIRRSSDGWSYIRIDGKYGYMMSRYLMSSGPVPPPPAPTFIPGVITPTPVPTATPTPASKEIKSIKLDPYKPTVGDTVKVLSTPADAEFTVVWYRDDNIYLGTGKQYKVKAADAGHTLRVRVMGAGASAGFAADAETGVVAGASAPEESSSSGSMVSEWVDPGSSSGSMVSEWSESTSSDGSMASAWADTSIELTLP